MKSFQLEPFFNRAVNLHIAGDPIPYVGILTEWGDGRVRIDPAAAYACRLGGPWAMSEVESVEAIA